MTGTPLPTSDLRPIRVINSTAPIRICDNGGWTDTWFARHGKVFNIAVSPCAEVHIRVFRRDQREEQLVVNAKNYGERFSVDPKSTRWTRHPLLEASICRVGIPDDVAGEITIFSAAPPGASTGTSAAVTVALLGALDRLRNGNLPAYDIARLAHSVETDMLHLQSGIQDQLASAYGGINFIEMWKYPHAVVTPVQVSKEILRELELRLALVYLGRSHSSSDVHISVIRELESADPECRKLADLRKTAEKSRDALSSGNFALLGQAMIENTEAQGHLHPDLISTRARRAIEIARTHGALGWKINGAGGEGGSLTILASPRAPEKASLLLTIEREIGQSRTIPVLLSRSGLRTWESPSSQ